MGVCLEGGLQWRRQHPQLPGKPGAHNSGLLSISYMLLHDIVACQFGLLGYSKYHHIETIRPFLKRGMVHRSFAVQQGWLLAGSKQSSGQLSRADMLRHCLDSWLQNMKSFGCLRTRSRLPSATCPNYPLRHPNYTTETITRPLIAVHTGVPALTRAYGHSSPAVLASLYPAGRALAAWSVRASTWKAK